MDSAVTQILIPRRKEVLSSIEEFCTRFFILATESLTGCSDTTIMYQSVCIQFHRVAVTYNCTIILHSWIVASITEYHTYMCQVELQSTSIVLRFCPGIQEAYEVGTVCREERRVSGRNGS